MAILKIIIDTKADLFIDQEFVTELQQGVLYKHNLSRGSYLIDVISSKEKDASYSFDLHISKNDDQLLKRIELKMKEDKACLMRLKDLFNDTDKSELISQIDIIEDVFPVGIYYWAIKLKSSPDHFRLFSKEKGLMDVSFDEIDASDFHVGNYDEHYYEKFIIKLNGKYGVLSEEGQLLIDCKYDRITGHYTQGWPLPIGLFLVRDNKWGYSLIRKNGILLDCKYDSIQKFNNKAYINILIVELDGKKALFNDKFITDFEYNDISYKEIEIGFDDTIGMPCPGFLISLDTRKYGIVDIFGKLIANPVYDKINIITDSISEKSDGNCNYYKIYGYKDSKWKELT